MTFTSVNTKEIKRRLLKTHGRKVAVNGEFTGWLNKMNFKCVPCGNEWTVKPQGVINGSGCPECVKSIRNRNVSLALLNSPKKHKKYLEYVLSAIKERELIWLNPENPPTRITGEVGKNLKFRHKACGYEWATTFNELTRSRGCPKCLNKLRLENSHAARLKNPKNGRTTVRYSTAEYAKYVKRNTAGSTKLISEWHGASQDRRMQCVLCKHEWDVSGGLRLNLKLNCPKCTKCKGTSGVATAWLKYEERRRRIKIRYSGNGGEFIVPGTRYRVDGYHARSKTVFEFHGDAYHGNPARFKSQTKCNPYSDKRASTLYRQTIKRDQEIRDLGYTVIVIWEREYRDAILHKRALEYDKP